MDSTQVDIPLHQPVLISSLIKNLPSVEGVWIDCTFGRGGYSEALLKAGAERIIGIDRDPDVINHFNDIKKKYGSKLELCDAKFSMLESIVLKCGLNKVSGVVFDIGVSSMQIDEAYRGFSFQKDGPLDMRMSQKGTTASYIVNNASEEELADIIYYYGEDRSARLIARAIVNERVKKSIVTTQHLSRVVKGVLKRSKFNNVKFINPATRTFQALRIAVNDELGELNSGLIAAERVLDAGGFLAVVSFHSLEDRLVKQFLKSRSRQNSGESRYLPNQLLGSPTFKALSNKAIRPDANEISINPRARSAKLRVAMRLLSEEMPNRISEVRFPKVKLPRGMQ